MIREAPAMTVRQNLGELLNEIQYRHDSILITKGGKPVAAMVHIGLFKKIRLLEDEFERLTSELAERYAGVDEATAEVEISAAVKAVRRKKAAMKK
jgi:prevent-host-death family protein